MLLFLCSLLSFWCLNSVEALKLPKAIILKLIVLLSGFLLYVQGLEVWKGGCCPTNHMLRHSGSSIWQNPSLFVSDFVSTNSSVWRKKALRGLVCLEKTQQNGVIVLLDFACPRSAPSNTHDKPKQILWSQVLREDVPASHSHKPLKLSSGVFLLALQSSRKERVRCCSLPVWLYCLWVVVVHFN